LKIGGHVVELDVEARHREGDLSGHHVHRILRDVQHDQLRGKHIAINLALRIQPRVNVGSGARLFVKRGDRFQHRYRPVDEVLALLVGEARDPSGGVDLR